MFAKPIGYSYRMVKGRGRMLFRNEPYATIIAEALDGFASGRFGSQAEVVRFLEAQPEYPKDRNGHVLFQHVNALLTRPVYAGMVEAPNWNIGITKGHHPALISYENYLKIQDRLKVKSVAPARKDISAEFPLRGVVVCHDCGTQLTSCYSKGRSKWYAIYFCFKKHCPSYRKSIRREKLEGDFEAILQQLQPSREIFGLAVALLKDWWDVRQASSKTRRQSVEDELRSNERAINQLLDRIIEADNPTVIKAYENRLRLLEQNKALCAEKAANLERPKGDFEKTVRSALVFLASPWEIYKNGSLEVRRMVLKLAFAERPTYSPKDGVRSVLTSSPFRILSDLKGGMEAMVHPTGFEPVAPRLGIWCSILLSYGCPATALLRGAAAVNSLRSILGVGRHHRKGQRRNLHAFFDQRLRLGRGDLAMDAGAVLLAIMHRARLLGKAAPDPGGAFQRLALRLPQCLDQRLHLRLVGDRHNWRDRLGALWNGGHRIGPAIALRPHRRRHHRLGHGPVAADRTGDQAARLLRLIIGGGAEPGLEHMALAFAFEVEHNHETVTSLGIVRRLASAGTRLRTSPMRVRSSSASPSPPVSPISSRTSPQGSITTLWP